MGIYVTEFTGNNYYNVSAFVHRFICKYRYFEDWLVKHGITNITYSRNTTLGLHRNGRMIHKYALITGWRSDTCMEHTFKFTASADIRFPR